MHHLLMVKGLWKYVDGSETLGDNATDAACTKFREELQKTISTIVMAISISQLYLVTSCEQPKDDWDAL